MNLWWDRSCAREKRATNRALKNWKKVESLRKYILKKEKVGKDTVEKKKENFKESEDAESRIIK